MTQTRSKIARASWDSLPKIAHSNGTTYVSAKSAAAYLGMHNKAFWRLCTQTGTKPDLDKAWIGLNLYSRATLDTLDSVRRTRGRPVGWRKHVTKPSPDDAH